MVKYCILNSFVTACFARERHRNFDSATTCTQALNTSCHPSTMGCGASSLHHGSEHLPAPGMPKSIQRGASFPRNHQGGRLAKAFKMLDFKPKATKFHGKAWIGMDWLCHSVSL